MDIFQILVLTLHITQVFTRRSRYRKHDSMDEEEDSIENLLYYKDCLRKGTEATTTQAANVQLKYDPAPPPPPPPPRQPECMYPKMCCSLTCGGECGGISPSIGIGRQMEPVPNFLNPLPAPVQSMPQQPIPQPRQPAPGLGPPHMRRKKKIKMGGMPKMQVPLGPNRRDFGFTKEKIKSLISRDDDIRKILKDLVRVTMQKVDLQNMMNSRRSGDDTSPAPITTTAEPYYDYDEL